jgi:hypothetical protein
VLVNADHPPKVLIRSDSAGATHGLRPPAAQQAGFSLEAVTDAPVRDGVEVLNTADGWYPAIDSSGATRKAPGVAEPTKLVDLSKGRPAPG